MDKSPSFASLVESKKYDGYACQIESGGNNLQNLSGSELRRTSLLGKGSYCNVFRVSTQSGTDLALKCMNQSRVHNSEEFVSATADLAMEARLNHRNIICL